MTTKDFLFRMQRFSILDSCVDYFFKENRLYIYHIVCSSQGISHETFIGYPTLSCFGDSVLHTSDSIYIDRFSRSQFDIQFKYFKSFYLSISKNQRSVLVRKGCCFNLIQAAGFKDETI